VVCMAQWTVVEWHSGVGVVWAGEKDGEWQRTEEGGVRRAEGGARSARCVS